MTNEPGVFEMRVGEFRVLEERSGDAGNELCCIKAGEGEFAVHVVLSDMACEKFDLGGALDG